MKSKAEIKKIVIDLGNKEIELSVDQAHKLYKILGDMFSEKQVATPCPYPVIVEKRVPYWTYPYEVWCGTGSHFDTCAFKGDTIAFTSK